MDGVHLTGSDTAELLDQRFSSGLDRCTQAGQRALDVTHEAKSLASEQNLLHASQKVLLAMEPQAWSSNATDTTTIFFH